MAKKEVVELANSMDPDKVALNDLPHLNILMCMYTIIVPLVLESKARLLLILGGQKKKK